MQKNIPEVVKRLTVREMQKQDALSLAETIYNIFKDSLSNDTISETEEDNPNDK